MTKSEAGQVLGLAQELGSHPRLNEALGAVGLSIEEFDRLMGAARMVTRRHRRQEILTPSGHGVRSR